MALRRAVVDPRILVTAALPTHVSGAREARQLMGVLAVGKLLQLEALWFAEFEDMEKRLQSEAGLEMVAESPEDANAQLRAVIEEVEDLLPGGHSPKELDVVLVLSEPLIDDVEELMRQDYKSFPELASRHSFPSEVALNVSRTVAEYALAGRSAGKEAGSIDELVHVARGTSGAALISHNPAVARWQEQVDVFSVEEFAAASGIDLSAIPLELWRWVLTKLDPDLAP